jgi:uncharacterized membrane protein YiaA
VILAEFIGCEVYYSYQLSFFLFSIMLFNVGLNYNIALSISKTFVNIIVFFHWCITLSLKN